MAFIRWRGNCAQLLASVWRDGRSQQVLLINLGGAESVTPNMQEVVAERYPSVPVDWDAVERELNKGPCSATRRDIRAALCTLATCAQDAQLSEDEQRILEDAAQILRNISMPRALSI